MFLEDGGRTLIKAGCYELKDGIKNGTKSFVVIDHEKKDVFLIPKETAVEISHPFAIMPDIIKAKTELETLIKTIRLNLA